MKNPLLLLCLCVVLVSCSKPPEVTRLEERDGLVYQTGQQRPFTGTFVEYSVYGQEKKRAERSYKEGKKDGLSILYTRDGKKASDAQYKEGLMNGVENVWYMNGQQASKGHYKNDQRDGPWTEWYTNGVKWKQGNYSQGKKTGLWTEWDEHGKVSKTKTY